MKILLLSNLFVLMQAADGFPPYVNVPDIDRRPNNYLLDLSDWKDSAFGGFNTTLLITADGLHYIVVDRMVTSGIPSSEVLIFEEEEKPWRLIKSLPLVIGAREFIVAHGRLVVVTKLNNSDVFIEWQTKEPK